MENKEIRFIDSSYNELFRIKDGESITVTDKNGYKENKTCYFYDTAHTEIDGNLYHICQWAEIMERNGSSYAPTQNYDRDKFFINDTGVTEVYHNPDADAGGQLVYNEISFELIREANQNTSNQRDFFIYLQSCCKQCLIDKGTPEYEINLKSFMQKKADFENYDVYTMRKLKKLAGIEPQKTHKKVEPER